MNLSPVSDLKPTWTVPIDQHAEMGIMIDDGCVVVLVQNEAGQWLRTNHIPMAVVDRLVELRSSGALDVAGGVQRPD